MNKIKIRFKEFLGYLRFFLVKTDERSSIDFIFSNYGVRIYQNREEFERLVNIFRKLNPKIILEIGSYKGGSLYIFSRQKKELEMISIDYPMKSEKLKWLKYFIINKIPLETQKLHLLKKDSQKIETVQEVKNILNGKKIDFLFIDADHSYGGVKKDFELYSGLVRKGGVIAFHDIASSEGVIKFWNEIEKNYDSEEIISKNNPIGIGVIKK
jgi:predicted O-methyltransferase YrrM